MMLVARKHLLGARSPCSQLAKGCFGWARLAPLRRVAPPCRATRTRHRSRCLLPAAAMLPLSPLLATLVSLAFRPSPCGWEIYNNLVSDTPTQLYTNYNFHPILKINLQRKKSILSVKIIFFYWIVKVLNSCKLSFWLLWIVSHSFCVIIKVFFNQACSKMKNIYLWITQESWIN